MIDMTIGWHRTFKVCTVDLNLFVKHSHTGLYLVKKHGGGAYC